MKMHDSTPVGGKTVLVLDDDALVRGTLFCLLSAAGYEVIFCADREALLSLCQETEPSCIVLDVMLPAASGLNILKDIRRSQVLAPILMISGQGNIDIAVKSIKDGAFDFVEKPFRGPEFLSSLKAAIDAAAPRKMQKSQSILDRYQGARLTPREQQIVEKLAVGMSSKQVARALDLSFRTIEGHRANIMKKLGARNATDLVRIALMLSGLE